MEETKPKKNARRPRKAGNSPTPGGPISDMGGPPCGHSLCVTNCMVRYVGPTSSIRDHHAMHAARGVTNVWTAAIVSGLAVVLTGTFAYTAVQARADVAAKPETTSVVKELAKMNRRLTAVEDLLKQHAAECRGTSTSTAP
jgi:hypothetical protein